MKVTIRRFILFSLCTLVILAGCNGEEPAPATPSPDTAVSTDTTPTASTPAEPVTGPAVVDSIEVLILESFPVQINVRVRGVLADGCTVIDEVNTNRSGSGFNVNITTRRETGQTCTEAQVPYEELVPLDVAGLPAGTYTVNVNGITGSFTLAVDNVAGAEPTAVPAPTDTPEPADTNQALINGRIWHDLCAVSTDAEGENIPSEGCVASAAGAGFQANGLLEDSEPGIPNVVVTLGEGDCPAAGLATATTDEDGDYVFTDLPAGVYCVTVDETDAANTAVLETGVWTSTGDGIAAAEITLTAGEVHTGVNFGWDYEFLPVPDVDLETCTNSIEFVQDLNIPDDTLFAPGQEFEKGWRLRNNGTCPWTTEYGLVFVGGDQIPAPETNLLTQVVVPGQTIDVSVQFTAPDAFGTYRSNWQLANAAGESFGINGLLEEAFWVQIEVGEADATPEPNSAAIGGVVWEDVCFLDANNNPSAGCAEIEDTGFYRADGSLNFNEGRLEGITVTLLDGACNDDGSLNSTAIITTTTTDDAGLYRFPDLAASTYCVAINAFSNDNVDLLIPGDWTWPFYGVGQQGLVIAEGEERLEVDFGWQYSE
ncbi:MAG: hypothetical protein KC421_03635 [Anaerolineales bacterium]|nr:hypothetical protein [Anaerolineales bacterium]